MDPMHFYDTLKPPFSVHGAAGKGVFFRMPPDAAAPAGPAVERLARQSAGLRIRFSAPPGIIRIRIELVNTGFKTHMTALATAGAELYEEKKGGGLLRRIAPLRPEAEGTVPFEPLDGYRLKSHYERICTLPEDAVYCLYLPLFSEIRSVLIGFEKGKEPGTARPYTLSRPIVFYGSSITQGACAGRPSLSFPARVCAALDADFVNLGLAGNAKGEEALARYIAALSMSAFVMDYDHNAPDADWLMKTHSAFFRIIRDMQPDLPVLIVSRPSDGPGDDDTDERCHIIKNTWLTALKAGDRHTAFLDGRTFYPKGKKDECLMDLVHPNDYGFHCIAQKMLPALADLMQITPCSGEQTGQ